MKLRILGCGTSSGVPRIGTGWGACDPGEPRNRRRRVSILVEHGAEDGAKDGEGGGTPARVLVDTGPDLREQLLDADVSHLDAVIWTHDHADHCHGIDDLRPVFHARRSAIPCFARSDVLATLCDRFAYAFRGAGGYPAMLAGQALPDDLAVGTLTVRSVDQPHGDILSTGLRFDAGGASIGYSTDCNVLTDGMKAMFEGVDIWIVDALRRDPHPSHASLDEALEWIAEVRPKRAILTHMDHSMDYATLAAALPAGVEPGYDGLEVLL